MRLGQQLTIIRPVPRNRNGDPLPGEPVEAVVPAAVFPQTSSENNDLRATVTSGLVAYLPAGTTIDADDKVRYPAVNGALYEVDGDPGRWVSSRTGTERFVQIQLRRVTG